MKAVQEIKPEEYLLTYEAKGLTPLFEDFFVQDYLTEGIVLGSEEVTREYMGRHAMKEMNEAGTELYASEEDVRGLALAFKNAVTEAGALAARLKEDAPLKSIELDEVFALFAATMHTYSYFDHSYTDTAFGMPETVAALGFLEEERNGMREGFNDVFWKTDGCFQSLIKKLAADSGVSEDDVRWHTRSEAARLPEGKRIDAKHIAGRKRAFAFHKEEQDTVFFEGGDAKLLIARFETTDVGELVTVLKGQTVNGKGIIRGVVRVLTVDYADFKNTTIAMEAMQEGEILVAPFTAPELMPACRKAAAIITDVGGMLSHAGITARELGIPCIVGTGNASKVFKTGDTVEVDTGKGTVTILK